MLKQNLTLLPKTKQGWWSLGLIMAMPVLVFIGSTFTNTLYPSVPAGDSILEDIAARPALAITSLAGIAAGILAFIVGLMAILRQKERGLLVFLATLIGALLLFALAAQGLFPQ